MTLYSNSRLEMPHNYILSGLDKAWPITHSGRTYVFPDVYMHITYQPNSSSLIFTDTPQTVTLMELLTLGNVRENWCRLKRVNTLQPVSLEGTIKYQSASISILLSKLSELTRWTQMRCCRHSPSISESE